MMRTSCIILTLLLALAACRDNSRTFTLKGTLKGIPEGKALVILPDTAHSRIDTIVIKDGQFTYELQTDTTAQLTLVFPGGRFCTVFADRGTETELTADTARWDSLSLRGGVENDALQHFTDSLRACPPDSIRHAVKEYVRKHPFSPVGAHLLNVYYAQTDTPDYAGIEEVIKLMSGKLQDNPIVQDLRLHLEDVIQADTGKYIASFRIKDKYDKFINAYQYGGDFLVVTFWAGWQPGGLELQKEILALKEAKDKKKEKVTFINVSLETDKRRWKDLQENDSLPDVQACDFEGWEGDMVKRFGVTDLPQIILLTPQRRVVLRSARLDEVKAELDTLLVREKEREKKNRQR